MVAKDIWLPPLKIAQRQQAQAAIRFLDAKQNSNENSKGNYFRLRKANHEQDGWMTLDWNPHLLRSRPPTMPPWPPPCEPARPEHETQRWYTGPATGCLGTHAARLSLCSPQGGATGLQGWCCSADWELPWPERPTPHVGLHRTSLSCTHTQKHTRQQIRKHNKDGFQH